MLLAKIVRSILGENADTPDKFELDSKLVSRSLTDTFKVTDRGLAYVNQILEKLNKKARRIGAEPLELRTLKTSHEKYHTSTGENRIRVWHEIVLEGDSPVIAGYKFVASVEHTAAGNIINMAPGADPRSLPAEYRTASATCDYCHTKRDRNNTFVLENTSTGELKRVGRNCLKNFLKGIDPTALLQYAAIISTLFGAVVGAEDMEDDDFGDGPGGGRTSYYSAREFFVDVCLAYFIDGKRFVSRKAAQAAADSFSDRVPVTTADFAVKLHNFTTQSSDFKTEYGPEFSKYGSEAKKLADAVYEWAEEKDWDAAAEANPAMSNYFQNLKVLVNSPVIQYKNASYHASLLAVYLREQADAERRQQAKTKSYIGNPGDKVKLDLTLKMDKWFDGPYGRTYLYIFNDKDENEVVYFSSRELPLEQGKSYTIAATVKAHQTSKYTGAPQTIITRGKIV